jgi:peroxiredoxin
MKPRLTPLSKLAIFTLALFTVFITWRAKAFEKKLLNNEEVSELVGKPAPDFTLYTLEGQKVSLADYHGKKKVVISFWASWCGPCRMEMPALRDFYKKNENHQDEFEMLAIDVDDDDPGDAEEAAKSVSLPFPVLLDRAGKAGRAYGVDAIPAMFIVDEQGKVTYAHTGFDQTMEYMLGMRLGFVATPQATQGQGVD